MKQYNEALTDYHKAIALKPDNAEAYSHRAIIYYDLKQYDEALAGYNKAIALNPDYGDAKFNKSILSLLLGDYKEGWKLYESRWQRSEGDLIERILPKPVWLGQESLSGKTILLHAEQGLGDTIQFCRYAPLLESMGAKVILQIPEVLVTLATTLSPTIKIITMGEILPDFDFHCPLMSLPYAFGTTLNSVPANIPYLFADTKKLVFWQTRLGTKSRPRIGLVWLGNSKHKNDHKRSINRERLTPLFSCNVEFHSLQKEVRTGDEEMLKKNNVFSHAENLKDFSDTAALIAEMDLVIAVDTSVAHLAGALGKKLWLLLNTEPDFRWMLQLQDTPWYPTARLFRQQTPGDWDGVISRVKSKLNKL